MQTVIRRSHLGGMILESEGAAHLDRIESKVCRNPEMSIRDAGIAIEQGYSSTALISFSGLMRTVLSLILCTCVDNARACQVHALPFPSKYRALRMSGIGGS